MRPYPERVARHILPLSVAQSLPAAFDEWKFTGHVEDHEDTSEVCQLCEQEGLRYQFEIENGLTCCRLKIGSQCILRFDIAVFDERGRRLSHSQAKRELDRLILELRHTACLKSLAALAAYERNDILTAALARLEHRGDLTPKQAWVVLWKLKQRCIAHTPEFFKINLRRWAYRRDLGMMEPDRLATLWPALSPSQRKYAEAFARCPPPPPPSVLLTPHRDPLGDLCYIARPAPRMIGDAAANGWTYPLLVSLGLTDASLVALGYMK